MTVAPSNRARRKLLSSGRCLDVRVPSQGATVALAGDDDRKLFEAAHPLVCHLRRQAEHAQTWFRWPRALSGSSQGWKAPKPACIDEGLQLPMAPHFLVLWKRLTERAPGADNGGGRALMQPQPVIEARNGLVDAQRDCLRAEDVEVCCKIGVHQVRRRRRVRQASFQDDGG